MQSASGPNHNQNNIDPEMQEQFSFVKKTVADGSYFKDAFDWYCFRYVTPVCDRTLLIFGAIISAIVLFFLITMIQGAFPLVEEVPVFLRSKDQSRYFPHIVDLKPKKNEAGYDAAIATVDEAVAKYLIEIYVKEREGFDFSKAEVEDVNKKLNHIKSSSANAEFNAFMAFMDKDNPASPINFFGQDVVKKIEIESVIFAHKSAENFSGKIKKFFSNEIPNKVEVVFTANTKKTTLDSVENNSERYLAKIEFAFAGVSKDSNDPLQFVVNSYKLFKIK